MAQAPAGLSRGEVALRPIVRADSDLLFRWRSDPRVFTQLFSAKAPTVAEHSAWIAKLPPGPDRLELMIEWQGEPVGTIRLFDIRDGRAEYGVYLGEDKALGKGVARLASELLLLFARDVLKLQTVVLEHFVDNTSAGGLYERLGFVEREGPRRCTSTVHRPVRRMECDLSRLPFT